MLHVKARIRNSGKYARLPDHFRCANLEEDGNAEGRTGSLLAFKAVAKRDNNWLAFALDPKLSTTALSGTRPHPLTVSPGEPLGQIELAYVWGSGYCRDATGAGEAV